MKVVRVVIPKPYQAVGSPRTHNPLAYRKAYLRGGYLENTLLTTSLNCFSRLRGVAFSL